MKKPIILASRSRARRELLRRLGVAFRVVAPRVKEHAVHPRRPEASARANALLKARDVARRLGGSSRGLVIGCDTFVVQGGRVCGKPKDMADARRMLRRLSRRPHTLYSGVALIDAERKKEWWGCARTKIFMEPLSDKEIRSYFRKVSPLDKAGAFDIQGRGGLFIRRIEGCYFNVVGLPLAVLARLFKKAGVPLLGLVCAFGLLGCVSTEFNLATQKKDWLIYTTEREVAIGDALARQMEGEYVVVRDPAREERVARIGARIAAVADRKDILYRFRVIEDKEDPEIINAVSLPGGYVYVFKKLMDFAASDDELAAVLAHEVAHIAARHQIKRMQAIWGYSILTLLSVQTQNSDFARGTQLAYASVLMEYAQEDELLADRLGARYCTRAGFDPGAMVRFLERLREHDRKEPAQPKSYFRTHPYYGERMRAAKEAAGQQINFKDYIDSM
ncbi:MAG: Maf family nucleotide pyrophosphatase [Deltaproteobacteria bacterium]